MTPDEIRRAVETGDIAALGRAQTAGADIRPQQPQDRPYRPEHREVTVQDFRDALEPFTDALNAALREQLDHPNDHEHAWYGAGYQMQADPPLWLEVCRHCSGQRLTDVPPGLVR